MSKPDDVSQWAWDAALKVAEPINDATILHDLIVDGAARAIMAAEKRGEDREREAILQFEFDLPVHRYGAEMMIAIRGYIRARSA